MRVLVWTMPAAIAVAAIAFATAFYQIEESKQRSFMMQACVKAGGTWQYNWGKPNCLGPRAQ